MRFTQIDKITEIEPWVRISAVKGLSLGEEYLRDHFPRFPVMPGVMMLEAMYQASAWLVRYSEDFTHAGVLLKEARNVRYGDFVAPGQILKITCEVLKQDEQTTTLKTQGALGENVAVSARLVLERFHLADRYPGREPTDAYARRRFREIFALLYTPAAKAPSA